MYISVARRPRSFSDFTRNEPDLTRLPHEGFISIIYILDYIFFAKCDLSDLDLLIYPVLFIVESLKV